MHTFPGSLRMAGTLSVTDGSVIVIEDRLSLQAGDDDLGNWSLDTLDVQHKGDRITISIDDEVVVFLTPDPEGLAKAVEEGSQIASTTAAHRNRRIRGFSRPRVGRKAHVKRRIELFAESQRMVDFAPNTVALEAGADPWLEGLAPDLSASSVLAPALPPAPVAEKATAPAKIESDHAARPKIKPDRAARPKTKPDRATKEPRRRQVEAKVETPTRPRRSGGRVRRSTWLGFLGIAASVPAAFLYPTIFSSVLLGAAGVVIMVAIAGIMDEAIEIRLQINVLRLFGLGLVMLLAGASVGMLL